MPSTEDITRIEESVSSALGHHGVFDVHEHLLGREQRRERNPDLFMWIAESYLWGDLVSAGMDPGMLGDQRLSSAQKWDRLNSLLPGLVHTGYMEVCRRAWQDLCAMKATDLNSSNWQTIDAAIREHTQRPGYTEDVLVQRCGMRHVLVDCLVGGTLAYFCAQQQERGWNDYLCKIRPQIADSTILQYTKQRVTDRDYLHRVVKLDSLMWGWLPETAAENEQLLGVDTRTCRSLDAYATLIESTIEGLVRQGVVGLKSTASTWRALRFECGSESLAAELLRLPVERLESEHITAFEDFVFHRIVAGAGKYGLPLQIHTGTSYGLGGRASTRAGAADQLADLVQGYQDTVFVLMHGSWPYWGEIEQMAKRFPNVYLDLSWCAMVSPVETQRMLLSMLTSLPIKKLVWGADCVYVEESYGAMCQMRRVLVSVLAELMSHGAIGESEAVDIAVDILCRNGVRLYRISD